MSNRLMAVSRVYEDPNLGAPYKGGSRLADTTGFSVFMAYLVPNLQSS